MDKIVGEGRGIDLRDRVAALFGCALLGLVAAAAPVATAAAADSLLWADFERGAPPPGGPRVSVIALSEVPGDVRAQPLGAADRMLQITGRIETTRGSQWGALGLDVAADAVGRPVDVSSYRSLRIRLASNAQRDLRIRLKGPDLETLNAGCYPVAFQRVAAAELLEIPLSAFEPEAYCGDRGVSVERTLQALASIEVTFNEPDASQVSVGVGRIEFFKEVVQAKAESQPAAPASGLLFWADEFDASASEGLDEARWTRIAVPGSGGAAHDGRGQLVIRPPFSMQQRDDLAFLFGRIDVRAQLAKGGRARITLRAKAPAGAEAAEGGEITLLDAAANRTLVGVAAPGIAMSQWLPQELSSGALSEGLHTFTLIWDPQHLQWQVDGQPVKTLAMGELSQRSLAVLDRVPFLLRIDAAAGSAPGMLIEDVRVSQSEAQRLAGQEAMAAWRAEQAKNVARNAPARPAEPAPKAKTNARPPVAAKPAGESAPRTVTCDRNKLGLMLCY